MVRTFVIGVTRTDSPTYLMNTEKFQFSEAYRYPLIKDIFTFMFMAPMFTIAQR